MLAHVKVGAVDLSEMLNDISVPTIEVPDFDVLVPTRQKDDLFAEHKYKAWKTDTPEARCDFAPNKMRISRKNDLYFISLWRKSIFGRTLKEIKADPDMVSMFANSLTPLIKGVLGEQLSPYDYAIVTTPKLRHKEHNFASLIALQIAESIGIEFFEDFALCHSKHRVGAIFTANNVPPHRNIIVFDDFVTTGATLLSMKNLLDSLEKNSIFFAGIYNHD